MAKLWDKGFEPDEMIERFTVGDDRQLDMRLARYDVEGSMAHIRMLEHIGLLTADELKTLLAGLEQIRSEIEEGRFEIEEGTEDVHSQVELLLTRRLGEVGKKIHAGRSRNDQVLVDLKLFLRDELRQTAHRVRTLFDRLQELSERYRDVLMPGYTHLQVAMPSSFGLWFGAYAETLFDYGETNFNAILNDNKNYSQKKEDSQSFEQAGYSTQEFVGEELQTVDAQGNVVEDGMDE